MAKISNPTHTLHRRPVLQTYAIFAVSINLAMKRSLALLCGNILFSFLQLSAQDLQWIRGGKSSDYHGAQVFAIANDKDGNVYTAGRISRGNVALGNNVTLSNTGDEVFLAKYDSAGRVLWGKTVGNAYWGSGRGMDLKLDASGNVYLMANFGYASESTNKIEGVALRYNNFFIAKYSPSGEVGWVKGYAGCVDNFDCGLNEVCAAAAIAIDKNYIYVTGHFRYPVKFDNISITPTKGLTLGNIDMFVAKIDLSGNVQFAKKYGGEASEFGKGIAVDKTGNIYVTGEGVGLAKFSNNGTLLKQKFAYSLTSGEIRPIGVGVDGIGNVYQFTAFEGEGTLGGKTIKSANRTALLIKYNSALDVQWHRATKESSKYSYLFSLSDGMETDSLGNTYICGDAENGLEFDEVYTSDGLFVIKFDATGAIKGANTIFTYDGNAHDVSVGPNGRYYLAGATAYELLVAAYKDTLKNTSPGWVALKNLRTGEITGKTAQLRWDDISDKETGFVIERSAKPGRNFRYVGSVPADSTSFVDVTGMLDDFTYYYRVIAKNQTQYSKYSSVVAVKTMLLPPPAATSFTATKYMQTNDVYLMWGAGRNTKRVQVLVSVGDREHYTMLFEGTLESTTFYRNALPNTPYYFKLRTSNEAGSSPVTEIIYYDGTLVRPAIPDDVVATPLSDTEIRLTWRDNATVETEYQIMRTQMSNGSYASVTDTLAANTTSVTVGSLLPNTLYSFIVRAMNYKEFSGYSAAVKATTFPGKPERPEGVAKVVSTSGATEYTVPLQEGLAYHWTIEPAEAGAVTVLTEEGARGGPCACSKISVAWNPAYAGEATVKVQAINAEGGSGEYATFDVTVLKPLAKAASPQGMEKVCDNIESTDYTTVAMESSDSYQWVLDPPTAGQIEGSGTAITIRWNKAFVGDVALRVGASNELETGEASEPFYIVKSICSVTAVEEQDPASRISIFPNPTEREVEVRVRPTLVNATFEIIRLDGALITTGVLRDTSTKLDVSNLSGLYLVKIQANSGTTYHKLWVK